MEQLVSTISPSSERKIKIPTNGTAKSIIIGILSSLLCLFIGYAWAAKSSQADLIGNNEKDHGRLETEISIVETKQTQMDADLKTFVSTANEILKQNTILIETIKAQRHAQ